MPTLITFIKENFDFSSGRASNNSVKENIKSSIRLKGEPLAITFCAFIIASVGLSANSTAVIIGAMLISPLMSPIIAIAYGFATSRNKIIQMAIIALIVQILLALGGSTLYFLISPIKVATPELTARITPGFSDVIIAFVGGIAGIVGITRKEKSNVIPGVAIATAIMPPLCTVGYGIATLQTKYIFGAGYLFLINVFFILVATMWGFKLMKFPVSSEILPEKLRLNKNKFIIAAIIITLPSIFLTFKFTSENIRDYHVTAFINSEINSNNTIAIKSDATKTDSNGNKILNIVTAGTPFSKEEVDNAQAALPKYDLDGYTLSINIGSNSDILASASDLIDEKPSDESLLDNLKTINEKINSMSIDLISDNTITVKIHSEDELSDDDKVEIDAKILTLSNNFAGNKKITIEYIFDNITDSIDTENSSN